MATARIRVRCSCMSCLVPATVNNLPREIATTCTPSRTLRPSLSTSARYSPRRRQVNASIAAARRAGRNDARTVTASSSNAMPA